MADTNNDTPSAAGDVLREIAKISDRRLPGVEAIAGIARPPGENPLIGAALSIGAAKEKAFNTALHAAIDSGEFDEVQAPPRS